MRDVNSVRGMLRQGLWSISFSRHFFGLRSNYSVSVLGFRV